MKRLAIVALLLDGTACKKSVDTGDYCDLADGDKKAKLKVTVDEQLSVKGWEVAP
jgi:hypothetical protein